MTPTTDLPVRTAAPAPELDELLAVRRATDPQFAGPRNEGSSTVGPKWVGRAARVTVALVVAVGAVLTLALFGGGALGRLEWLFLATGLLALALWATRQDDLPDDQFEAVAPWVIPPE